MSIRPGYFVTFEGIEGVGKSTQVQLAVESTRDWGIETLVTREPGGTPLAEALRGLVLQAREEAVTPAAELMIMHAARAQHSHNLIKPALHRGALVICDRYADASYAYQGGGRGIDTRFIDSLAQLAQDGLSPDLTFLLDAPVVIALARAKSRAQACDRIEAETMGFFERVRASYLARARAEPDRFRVLDATAPVDFLATQIKTQLQHLLGRG